VWDVSEKGWTLRQARARAVLLVHPATIDCMRNGLLPKGDPLPVAKVAAIQAAKNTSNIIPYCHPLPIDNVAVDFAVADDRITVTTLVKATYKTGVEMEALTAATVAALTIYDMLKMLDMGMQIAEVSLIEKRGGKSDYAREESE
jgi:cyclic pyranopterin monophosphate synthase